MVPKVKRVHPADDAAAALAKYDEAKLVYATAEVIIVSVTDGKVNAESPEEIRGCLREYSDFNDQPNLNIAAITNATTANTKTNMP